MLILRSLIFNVLFYAALILLMVVGLPTLLAGRRAAFRVARAWAAISIWLLRAVCGLKVEFRGHENLPSGPCIIAAKHQSLLETFALITHVTDFTFILKRELTFIPFFGWYLRATEQIAIDRASGRAALDQVTEKSGIALAQGRQVFIFPEGTRRAVGAEPKYKGGVSHIYAAAHAPCVPVALNTGLFWPRRSFVRRPGTVVIEYLPAIPPGLERNEFARLLQEKIESACDRLVGEALAKDPSLMGGPAR
ncbi:MAG: phospholipid/glycerol acyltransferase [Hyphomicrobiales bacterium]|jgi:1-acyl-sn-glycerol-3-phosphate acyltransferase|nr:phospholipid/glycerol acyltransferase [Hyphomicrobiales bacterium]